MKEFAQFVAVGTLAAGISSVASSAIRDRLDEDTVNRFNVPCDSKSTLVVPFKGVELTRADTLDKKEPVREKVPAGTKLCIIEQTGGDISQLKIKDKEGTTYIVSIKAK